jgi:hypothetical protein
MLLNTKIPPTPSSYLLTPFYFMKKSAKVPRKLPSEPFEIFKLSFKHTVLPVCKGTKVTAFFGVR